MSHVVIVGGSKGIGANVQAPLMMAGHFVTVLGRGKAPEPYYPLPVDAMLLCQRWRPVESAGYGDTGKTFVPYLEHHRDMFGEFDVSILRTKDMCEWASEHMDGGSIVVMASVAGVSVEEEQPVSYHACKAALIEMVKYYAVMLGPKQIRVNAIIPGLTIKPEARAFYDANPELEATYKDITPLGRMGTVEDIANLVDFLISEKSSYLTGQTITLDGGIGLRSHWALARRVSPELRNLQVTQRAVAK